MTDYVTPTTWEQCARHVEAGGVVEIEDAPGVWINDRAAATTYRGRCGTPDDGWAPRRRLVPIESAAPANGVPAVPTGAERYLAERLADPEYRAAYEAAAPAAGDDLRERIARAIYEEEHDGPWKNANHPDWVQSLRSADAVLAVLPPQPTPSPVPPWPGAVLSGCVDEDGEPTWLAQAWQVRGEQVRQWRGDEWLIRGYLSPWNWVEVRAPRTVPVPETERVQLGVAVVGGLLAICREGATLDLGRGDVKIHTENGASVASTSESMFTVEIAPDGTVEVLKDGDR